MNPAIWTRLLLQPQRWCPQAPACVRYFKTQNTVLCRNSKSTLNQKKFASIKHINNIIIRKMIYIGRCFEHV